MKEDLKNRKSTPKYPTDLRDLDRVIWGIHKKELFVIGARPSMGKTSLAGQLAFNLSAAHFNVLFISLEMSKEQIVERLFCNVTRVNNLSLREGKVDDEIKSRMDVFDKLIEELPLCVVDQCGYNFSDIETLIEEMEPKPDIVFIDYIQLISQGRFNNKVSAIEEYFRRLKELSIKYNLAMIVLSQIRRMEASRQNKRPTMDELKGSGCVHGNSLVYKGATKCFKAMRKIYKEQDFFPVETINIKTKKRELITPSRIIDTGKLHCYRVKTKGGKEIILSKDTKLFDNKWIKAIKLKIGNKIYVQKQENFILDKIVEIEDLGDMQTYDFTIPKTHCFFANNILVHNSLEEHSDTIALIYWIKRNEFSHPDINEFEINIAKQRHGPTGLVKLNFYPQHFSFKDREEENENSYNE